MTRKYTKYTEDEKKWLAENYMLRIGDYQAQFNELFNRDIAKHNLCMYRRRMGFKVGRTGQFGNDRALHPDCGAKKANSGSFKKGHTGISTLDDGSEVTDTRGYVRIKIGKGQWVDKHRYIYEQKNGKLEKGQSVTFKDGNKLNFDIDNLEALTRQELMQINTLKRLVVDESLREPVRQLGKLKAAINLKNS